MRCASRPPYPPFFSSSLPTPQSASAPRRIPPSRCRTRRLSVIPRRGGARRLGAAASTTTTTAGAAINAAVTAAHRGDLRAKTVRQRRRVTAAPPLPSTASVGMPTHCFGQAGSSARSGDVYGLGRRGRESSGTRARWHHHYSVSRYPHGGEGHGECERRRRYRRRSWGPVAVERSKANYAT